MPYFVPSSQPDEGLGVLLLFKLVEQATPKFFSPDRQLQICRAPGRLDVMSGFGDEASFSVHVPTAEAASAAIQLRDDDFVRLWSPGNAQRSQILSVRLGDLIGTPSDPVGGDDVRAFLGANPADAWSAHVLGAVHLLAAERGVRPEQGFDMLLFCDLAEAGGAGSSAAVEVAAMHAIATAYGLPLRGPELAALARRVEAGIVGRDAGASAQVTAACGSRGHVLALRGDNGDIEADFALPDGLEIVGIDSGAGIAAPRSSDAIIGRAENERAARFAALLQQPLTPDSRRELGELMFGSHAARAAAGQRHPAVDLLIEKARERHAAAPGLIGASATGRGTVALLGEHTKVWHEALRLKKALRSATGHSAHILRWSSPGAAAFGSIELRPVTPRS